MRIAYLVNQYPMVSLTFIRREIHALERQGFEVMRFALRAWTDTLVDEADLQEARRTRYVQATGLVGVLGALLWAMATRPGRLLRALALSWRVSRRSDRGLLLHGVYLAEATILCRWLLQAGVDHLHAHFAGNSAEIAMFSHELGGPGYSFTVHGPEDFDRAQGLNYPETIGRARFVAAISDFCRSQLYRWVSPRQWDKIHIVRCGVDERFLRQTISPVPQNATLVSIGRLSEQKGQHLLVQAAARLRDDGIAFKLILIGDGELREDLERLIARLDLADCVHIAGWCRNDQVLQQLMESRAMVLPSFAEGLPVVIMESLAVGRPVVATHIAGIPELVIDRVTGWLVPAGNVELLAAAMAESLQAQPNVLQSFADAGRIRVNERHDAGREAARLGALIRRAATRADSQATAMRQDTQGYPQKVSESQFALREE